LPTKYKPILPKTFLWARRKKAPIDGRSSSSMVILPDCKSSQDRANPRRELASPQRAVTTIDSKRPVRSQEERSSPQQGTVVPDELVIPPNEFRDMLDQTGWRKSNGKWCFGTNEFPASQVSPILGFMLNNGIPNVEKLSSSHRKTLEDAVRYWCVPRHEWKQSRGPNPKFSNRVLSDTEAKHILEKLGMKQSADGSFNLKHKNKNHAFRNLITVRNCIRNKGFVGFPIRTHSYISEAERYSLQIWASNSPEPLKGFSLRCNQEKWDINYAQLVEFKEQNGHFQLKSEDNKKLLTWLNNQRSTLTRKVMDKALTETDTYRLEKLKQIGLDWQTLNMQQVASSRGNVMPIDLMSKSKPLLIRIPKEKFPKAKAGRDDGKARGDTFMSKHSAIEAQQEIRLESSQSESSDADDGSEGSPTARKKPQSAQTPGNTSEKDEEDQLGLKGPIFNSHYVASFRGTVTPSGKRAEVARKIEMNNTASSKHESSSPRSEQSHTTLESSVASKSGRNDLQSRQDVTHTDERMNASMQSLQEARDRELMKNERLKKEKEERDRKKKLIEETDALREENEALEQELRD